MPDTFTANYNLTKPEVNGSRDTWGTKDNANLDVIDGVLKNLSDNKLANNGTKVVTGATNFRTMPALQVLEADTPAPLITEAAVKALINAFLPIGTIVIWSGTIASIPPNWKLCNGANGTPNLSDRFVIQAGVSYAVGGVGGTTFHQHTVFGTQLVEAHMPFHSHTVIDPSHAHTGQVASHNHNYQRPSATSTVNAGVNFSVYTIGLSTINSEAVAPGVVINAAYTGIQLAGTGGNAAHGHSIDAQAHMPPYMALCYIMKVSSV